MLRLSTKVIIPDTEIQWQMVRAQGPGGQHVNKTSCAAQLFFDIRASSLPTFYRERLLGHQDHRITDSGVIIIKAQDSRSLEMNRELALKRLREIILAATKIEKKRRPTRPTRNSQKRRVESKKKQGEKKAMRRRPE
ncbi:alternative ribosome rescue aminoacyl-tRNA hydrolase ArfB [Cerasicoccus arenae]|uniref:Aminoacyl-tRNA hydrolase n=1 Tax=Cerasicoccus arenae TaxID=424488 RepID=A0A8J3D938_9BACT|nr:alternative ribosome rescue aminoacyl-tRNA hydrolase ArfB [Cerasicoccus arenae]MBK1857061.1 aminoacyl-tRNA hydrolase [Cerasicoccus arenae]GHB92139.1 aminoacyl-tRNA hydrolase [Cerasicoccus arenae]